MQDSKYFFFIILMNIFAGSLVAQPVINSFSPVSGPVGTTVVISGNNFDAVIANNIVFFGNVRATVSAASLTSLTVTVPIGATYLPISVTVNRLTGFSSKSFITTFGCGAALTPVSFANEITFPAVGPSWHVATGDLDGDGKTDLVYSSWTSQLVSVFRNTSVPGNVSFDTRMDLVSGSEPDETAIADFDGDGKLDMAVVNTGDSATNISVFKNTSVPGTITFEPKFSFGSGLAYGDNVISGDIDGDGKLDLIVTYSDYNRFSILKNTSNNGTISFSLPIFINVQIDFLPVYPGRSAVRDLDGDGRADIAFLDPSFDSLRILRNTSASGIISFVQATAYSSKNNRYGIFIADLDADNKPDIITSGNSDTAFAIFKNNSSVGAVSFDLPIKYSLKPGESYATAVADMDGDGKPDIVATTIGSMAVIKNNSSPGNFSFAPKQLYELEGYLGNVSVADIDNDGKTDIVAGVYLGTNHQNITILRNQQCDQIPFCPGGNNSLLSNLTGSVYQWQVNTGSGYTNIMNDTHYSAVTSSVLQLTNIPSSWYGYKYRCVVDGSNSTERTIVFINTWTGNVSTAWENPLNWSCGSVPDAFTDVYIPVGPIMINTNTTIRTLIVFQGANITVVAGNTLTVLH